MGPVPSHGGDLIFDPKLSTRQSRLNIFGFSIQKLTLVTPRKTKEQFPPGSLFSLFRGATDIPLGSYPRRLGTNLTLLRQKRPGGAPRANFLPNSPQKQRSKQELLSGRGRHTSIHQGGPSFSKDPLRRDLAIGRRQIMPPQSRVSTW